MIWPFLVTHKAVEEYDKLTLSQGLHHYGISIMLRRQSNRFVPILIVILFVPIQLLAAVRLIHEES